VSKKKLGAALAASAFLALGGLSACGFGSESSSSSGSTPDARGQVQQMIRSQLPGSVKRSTGQAVLVDEVTCAQASKSEFDCFATVRATNGTGGLERVDLAIAATCDEASCTWRTE
jgi:hypothetical protein